MYFFVSVILCLIIMKCFDVIQCNYLVTEMSVHISQCQTRNISSLDILFCFLKSKIKFTN